MALKETLNGFSQIKKHAAKSAMKTLTYSAKKSFENGQCYCTSLKCKIVYDDTVYN